MKRVLLGLLVAPLLLAQGAAAPAMTNRDPWYERFTRESNSSAETRRGIAAYGGKRFEEAASAFGRADAIVRSAAAAFNFGTAEAAAGRRASADQALARAAEDPALRADASFNRGNAALTAGANEEAIAHYISALRANGAHAAAKRNLEIALRRRDQQRRQGDGNEQGSKGGGQQPQSKRPGGEKPQQGAMDLDALLRSVAQQEQEELRRMKGRAAEGKVGW